MRRTVFVACDSANGDRAPIAFARAVAPLFDASVELVNVRASDGLAGTEADDTPAPAFESLRVLRATSPAAGLQRLITEERPVLTVLGSAHDALHGRVRVGGTAERVVYGATQAVAVVPRGHGDRPLETIGVGLLPTEDSLRALRVAASLARAAGAQLVVLTVLRRSPAPEDAVTLAESLAPGVTAGPPRAAAGLLRAAIESAARAAGAALAVEPLVLVGDPADALLRVSGQVGLLVLGSRAYGPPGVVLPGGAARRVLAGARCPVLLVPRAEVTAPVAVRA